jgi:phosphohistidine phosphatase
MGAVLRQAEVMPLAVWASPYRRAQETATRVMETLAMKPERLITAAELAPQGAPEALWRKLGSVGDPRILLVGHLPSIAILAGWLLGAPHTALRFRKAALARIDVSMPSDMTAPVAELSWFVPAFLAQALD